MIMKTFKEVLSSFLIFIVYFIFKDVISMISNYLEDVDFKNYFLTSYFWYIDEKRNIFKKSCLKSLKKNEMKKFELLNPFSLPTKSEIKESWTNFTKWIVILIISLIIIFMDYYFYKILIFIFEFMKSSKFNTQGDHVLNLEVEGEGPVSQMIKDLLNFNFTDSIEKNFEHGICVPEPSPPNFFLIFFWILVPLFFMFFIQIIFNFIIKRIIFFFILGYVFRKRSKTRIIQLYNKLLFYRINEGRFARSRIRFMVEQQELQRVEKK